MLIIKTRICRIESNRGGKEYLVDMQDANVIINEQTTLYFRHPDFPTQVTQVCYLGHDPVLVYELFESFEKKVLEATGMS